MEKLSVHTGERMLAIARLKFKVSRCNMRKNLRVVFCILSFIVALIVCWLPSMYAQQTVNYPPPTTSWFCCSRIFNPQVPISGTVTLVGCTNSVTPFTQSEDLIPPFYLSHTILFPGDFFVNDSSFWFNLGSFFINVLTLANGVSGAQGSFTQTKTV